MKGLKLIGRGSFSKVYSNNNLDYVVITQGCKVKQVMGEGLFPDSRYFPVLEEIKIGNEYFWKMKKYNKTKKIKDLLTERDYIFYKKLVSLFKKSRQERYKINHNDYFNYFFNLFESSNLEEDEKEAMLDALRACSNYSTQIFFEISPRNIFIDNGNLILADCFFILY